MITTDLAWKMDDLDDVDEIDVIIERMRRMRRCLLANGPLAPIRRERHNPYFPLLNEVDYRLENNRFKIYPGTPLCLT